MSVLAYITGAHRLGIAPVLTCGWHEAFDEADYAAFYAKYVAQFPRDTGLIAPPTSLVEIAGSALVLHAGAGGFITFTPPLFTAPALESWFKVVVEAAGGDWDGTSQSMPVNMVAYDSAAGSGDSFAVRRDGISAFYSMWCSNGTTVDTHDGTHPVLLPVGVHTFIVCSSRPVPTTLQCELWIDAAPGDAADATSSVSTTATRGLDAFLVRLCAPDTTGRSLIVHSIDAVCGDRASDPFGIL